MEQQGPALGPWFPKGTAPAHVGVYEVDQADNDGRAFSYWDGKHWCYVCWTRFFGDSVEASIEEALKYSNERRFRSEMFGWRGLLQRPAA